VGPIFGSAMTGHYAHSIKAQVLATGPAPEVIVARHLGLEVACVGVVVSALANDRKPQPPIDLEQVLPKFGQLLVAVAKEA